MKKFICRFKWIFVFAGIPIYFRFGFIPPKRLSGVELAQRQSCAKLEIIARDVKAYMKKYDGNRPASFVNLSELDIKYLDAAMYANYCLPSNQTTDVLAHEKPDIWKDKTVAIYLNGRYGASRVNRQTFNGLLDGTIEWKDLGTKNKKK